MASVFAFWQIALSAGIAATVSLGTLLLARRWQPRLSFRECIMLALIVGLSVMVYRSAANTPSLNDDPIPAISPNDVLCPVVTSVALGLYAGVHRHHPQVRFEQIHIWLVLVSLVVNVITI